MQLTLTCSIIFACPITVAATNFRIRADRVVTEGAFQDANSARTVRNSPTPLTATRIDYVPCAFQVAMSRRKEGRACNLEAFYTLVVHWAWWSGGRKREGVVCLKLGIDQHNSMGIAFRGCCSCGQDGGGSRRLWSHQNRSRIGTIIIIINNNCGWE